MRKKAFISVLVVGALIQAMAVPSLAEANLWSERRMAARRHRDTSDRMGKGVLASLPAEESLGGIPFSLQPIVPLSLQTLSSSVSKNLPGEFQLQHEALLNAFPLTCGSVRKVTQPSVGQRTSKIVIDIQDVHQNEAAQRKIGHAIEALVEKGQAGRIALEGAWGPVQINGLREFSRPDLLRTVADYLLRVHKISGPVHSAITGSRAFPPIIGVDDPDHYRANVAAYQRAAPRQTKIQESLRRIQADLDRRWERELNPPLLSFVKLTQSFHNEDISLGSYIRAILPDAPNKAVGPSLRTFLEALDLERGMDFKQVERERGKLLEGLVRRMDAGAIEKLAQKSMAYRLGKTRYSEFYGDLQTLCIKNGMDLHRYPGMDVYIRYVLTADKIDPGLLFPELRALEDSIRARLIKTPSEKRLVGEGTVLGLAKKLADFSLTTEEWNQYQSLRGESLSRYKLDLQDFEAFYREAQARDAAMVKNVLREMETNPSQPVVLVTGGFHSSGLADRLTRAGVTVISFTPRMDKIDTAQGSAYLSVFSQEKTPLESLFQGQKLFLATPPADTGEIPFLTATTAAAEQQEPAPMSKIFANKYDEAARLLGFQNIKRVLPKIEIQRVPDGNRIITVHWRNNSYQVFLGQGKINNFRPAHPPLEGIWEKILSFIKRGVLRIINGFFPREIAEGKSELPHVDLTESGDLGFAKERLLSAFKKTRDQLIAQGRPDGRPYFPYLYESKEREFVIEADGIKIVLVDVAERADYDKPRRLSAFVRHPRDIREGHPNDNCLFCRLLKNNSMEFFAKVQGTGGNIYRATVNLGEYGYPHFQFISEDPVPNLYDRDNRLMDFLLSARALGPEFGVMINGPFSGASQRHLHFHGIKRKEGGLWAYIDSLSQPNEIGLSMREELANYPGRPILFRGSSLEELNEQITKEITALYDDQISAGVHARVRTDGTFEVVVAPTRGEAMVAFDVILHGSDEEFERHRTAVRNYNLFGILDPTFDPIAEGMGATHTPGAVPNILMELPEGFKADNRWQARTAHRLTRLLGDYNPRLFLSQIDRPLSSQNMTAGFPSTNSNWQNLSRPDLPLRVIGFFPSLASRKFYIEVPTLYQKGNENVDQLYLEAATALNLFGPDGRPDPTQLSMQNLPIGEGKPGAVFRDFILFNLAMEILFQSEARRRGILFKTEAYAGISAGLITATAASGSLSIKDVAKLADYFWTNVLQEAHHVLGEPVQYYTVYVSDPEGYSKKIAKSPLNGIVEVYHYVSPDSLQVLVPLSHIPSFAGFNQSMQGVRTEPIRGPTREFSHSARLTTARQRLEIFMEREGIFFQDPKIPILSNNGGTFLKSAEEVKSAILAIVDEPMKTDQTVKNLSTLNPDLLIEFGLGEKGRRILELNGSRIPCQSSGMNAETNDSLFSAMIKLSKGRNPLISIPTLAQTPLTNRTWQYVRKHLGVSPISENSRQMEFAFTSIWEFFLHWALPFFVISWIFTRFGVPVPDMWLIPLLAAILEPVFIGSHSLSNQGKDLSRLAHFLMAFYGSGGVLISWGGWGIVVGVVLIISGLLIHYIHDISRAPPSSSDEGQGQNPGSGTMASETALRSILNLPAPDDMKLRSATARFTFVASLDETAVRDHSAVTSKNALLSMLDAYAKGGEGWKGDLGQAVQEENAGVWVVPVGADRKGLGAMARACLSSRGRDTEIRFVAENEAVAFALRFWSFGRSRVQVQTVPEAFSLGSGNRRVFRLAVAQEALARDMSLRSRMAWRIVAPESLAMDYLGLPESSPLWSAPVVFLDALLRSLPVPVGQLRDLDSVASRLIKRMA